MIYSPLFACGIFWSLAGFRNGRLKCVILWIGDICIEPPVKGFTNRAGSVINVGFGEKVRGGCLIFGGGIKGWVVSMANRNCIDKPFRSRAVGHPGYSSFSQKRVIMERLCEIVKT